MSQIIPKIIHQIWLGDGDIPIKYLSFIDSWKSHHPDWEYHLWTVNHLIPLKNQRSYDQTTDVVQKTNIVRYEVLYQYGGIYVELDTACFKNIEPLLDDVEFFVETKDDFYFSNELMGCTPHHELMGELVEGISRSLQTEGLAPIDEQSGSLYMMKYLLWMPEVTILEEAMFIPSHTELLQPEDGSYCYRSARFVPSLG